MIIYLKYPRRYGFFSWDELSLVARILGFDGELFRRNFPAFITCQTDEISAKLLLKLVCDNTYLHAAVDATANLHFFPWNICAIHKTILLLNERLLTFGEIHSVRVAYLFYEGIEANGLPVNGSILQKTLKLCGRMISPQELLHRMCHMIPQLQESDFLQLHEFLDLVLWTELHNPLILKEAKRLGLVKDRDGCFQMSDFEELLKTVDDRLSTALDARHKVKECTYSESKSTRDTSKEDVTESYINPTFRLMRTLPKARSEIGNLTNMLNQSRCRMKQFKFGYGNRPTTALSLKVTGRIQKSSLSKIQMVNEHSDLGKTNLFQQEAQMVQMDSPVADTDTSRFQDSTGCPSKPIAMSSRSSPDDVTCRRADRTGFATPNGSAFSKYRIPSIVTDEDLQRTSQLIDDLKFDETTLATRSEHLIDNIWLRRRKKTTVY